MCILPPFYKTVIALYLIHISTIHLEQQSEHHDRLTGLHYVRIDSDSWPVR